MITFHFDRVCAKRYINVFYMYVCSVRCTMGSLYANEWKSPLKVESKYLCYSHRLYWGCCLMYALHVRMWISSNVFCLCLVCPHHCTKVYANYSRSESNYATLNNGWPIGKIAQHACKRISPNSQSKISRTLKISFCVALFYNLNRVDSDLKRLSISTLTSFTCSSCSVPFHFVSE